MALSLQNRSWHSRLWALAAATLQCLQPSLAAGVSNEKISVSADSSTGNLSSDGKQTLELPIVRQGSTLLKALKAEVTSKGGESKDSTYKFTGDVHLEFDGAVMDAQSATAVFINNRLSSVDVMTTAPGQPKKLVHVVFKSAVLDVDAATVALADGRIRTIQARGTPSQFSYQLKKSGRRVNGRAGKIDYDAVKNAIRFSVDTWYTDGRSEAKTPALTYNFGTEIMVTEALDLTYDSEEDAPEERVPAPRTPDRASAK
ncbi:MAG: LptA/OstA family protein [Pseudomonadota bacterium]